VKQINAYLIYSLTALFLAVQTNAVLANSHSPKPPRVATNTSKTLAAYKAASRYTVKIRARVATPFISDHQGVLLGTGFLIDKKRGWILTIAQDVVSLSPSDIKIKFTDKHYIKANKIYIDPTINLAILAVTPKLLPKNSQPASLNCHQIPEVGSPVVAFGYPTAAHLLVSSRGVISGIKPNYKYGEMIQSDTPVALGGDGGPLISLASGKIIGVNTEPKSKNSNINYAIPIKHICQILSLLKRGKNPLAPLLPYAFYRDYRGTKELTVAHINTLKDTMKLKEGDTIIGIVGNKEAIENKASFVRQLRGKLNKVTLRIKRNDKLIQLKGNFTPIDDMQSRLGILFSGALYANGIYKNNNNFIRDKPSVVIHHITKGSISDFSHLKKYDSVISINNEKVTNLNQFFCRLVKLKLKATPFSIEFIRMYPHRKNPYIYLTRKFSPTAIQIHASQNSMKTNLINNFKKRCLKSVINAQK